MCADTFVVSSTLPYLEIPYDLPGKQADAKSWPRCTRSEIRM